MPTPSSSQSRASASASSSSQGRKKKSKTPSPAAPATAPAPGTPFNHPRENLHDVILPRIISGFEPIRGLKKDDLRNLRLTHPMFRNLLNVNAAWQHVYARNPLLRILWKAKEQNIRWVVETQSMRIDDYEFGVDTEVEPTYMKNQFTPHGVRYIEYNSTFDIVSDVTDNFIVTQNSRHGYNRVVSECVKAILQTDYHQASAYLKEELSTIQKPFYLNMYLPGVRAESREDFLDEFKLFSNRHEFDMKNEGNTGAELSQLKLFIKEWIVWNESGTIMDEHDTEMFPFYINIFFGAQKPKFNKSIRRVLKGCPLRV